ncbi:MAG: T9SS type A sorting domain-containing protein [Bacteroidota bacterium]
MTLRNEGVIAVASTLTLEEGAEIENGASGVIEILGGSILDTVGDEVLSGSGRIAAVGSGGSVLGVPLDLDGATMEVSAPSLLVGGGSLRDVTFDVAEGSTLNLTASNTGLSGTFEVAGTLSGDVEGTLFLGSTGTLAVGSRTVTLDMRGNGLRFSAGSGRRTGIEGSGGTVTNLGRVAFQGNSFLNGVTFVNENDARVTSTLTLTDDAVLLNAPGRSTTFESGGSIGGSGDAPGTFRNEGLVLKTDGGTMTFGSRLRSQPGSELRVLNGGIRLFDEEPANIGAGVLLTGGGPDAFVSTSSSTEFQHTVSPGTPEAPIAELEFFRYFRMSSSEGDATLVIDVGPDGASDRIAPQRTILLGGTLVVRVQDGFTPQFGDEWTIIRNSDNSAVRGGFSQVVVENGPPGVTFAVDASAPGAVVLRAVAGVTVSAPKPAVREGGDPLTLVLSHPASVDPFSIAYELEGTATLFEDYTLTATRGTVRAAANTTQTLVTLFPRRDTEAGEGAETVVFRVVPGGDATPAPGKAEVTVTIEDGPSSDVLAVEAVVPSRGAAIGTVTPTILGTGFGSDVTARLVGPGGTITASLLENADERAGVSAAFDLEDVALGTYDVVVEQGGETSTLAGGFEVIEGERVAAIWADISGPPAPRNGRWSTYTVTLGNDTDADVHDVALVLRVTNGAEIEFLEGIQDLDDAPASEQGLVMDGPDGAQFIPLWFKKLPARSSGTLRLRARPASPLGIGDDFGVAYQLYPPDNGNPFTWSGDFDDAVPLNYGLLWGTLAAYVEAFPPGEDLRGTHRHTEMPTSAALRRGGEGRCPPDNTQGGPPPIQDQSVDDLLNGYSQGNRFNRYHGGNVAPSTSTAVSQYAGFSLEQLLVNATRSAGYAQAGGIAGLIFSFWDVRNKGLKSQRIICERQGAGSLPDNRRFGDEVGPCGPPGDPPGGPPGGPGGGGIGGPGGGACGVIGGSFDPNDKLGPSGFGEERFYDPDVVTTPYVIRFENLDTATFPAQEVFISDTLDATRFDLSTFSLGSIRWGESRVVTPPPGATSFETEVSLAPEFDATLLITAGLDRETGRASWTFVTIDNATGDLPEDGRVGFLPPNVTSPEGEGSVTFTVEAREALSTGDRVQNRAEIVFDINEPIVTPLWSNTVDVTAPVSTVDPLLPSETNPVTITVSGMDAGSGIELYGLFASQDGADFELFALSSEPTFEVDLEAGSTYGFYSVAADAVGNPEPFKTEAEATTLVVVDAEGGPTLPTTLTLAAPRPNPVRRSTTLRYGLPQAGTVRVRVVDLLGREVAVLADGEAAAGWHEAEWTPRVAAGVYTVEVRAGDAAEHQRLTVVR